MRLCEASATRVCRANIITVCLSLIWVHTPKFGYASSVYPRYATTGMLHVRLTRLTGALLVQIEFHNDCDLRHADRTSNGHVACCMQADHMSQPDMQWGPMLQPRKVAGLARQGVASHPRHCDYLKGVFCAGVHVLLSRIRQRQDLVLATRIARTPAG